MIQSPILRSNGHKLNVTPYLNVRAMSGSGRALVTGFRQNENKVPYPDSWMFSAPTFRYSVPFSGSTGPAFDVARTALLSLGFEVVTDTESRLAAEGPGMHSNRQPALMGATTVDLRIDGSAIRLEAELGGVAFMKAFIYLFPPGLVLSLFLINLIAGGTAHWPTLLVVLPWLLNGPLMARSMEKKTTTALERLVRGMSQSRSS